MHLPHMRRPAAAEAHGLSKTISCGGEIDQLQVYRNFGVVPTGAP